MPVKVADVPAIVSCNLCLTCIDFSEALKLSHCSLHANVCNLMDRGYSDNGSNGQNAAVNGGGR